jgi:hypothetical protein
MSSCAWDRSVPWRQGSFIPNDPKFGFASSNLIVVVSHDCDCVNDDLSKEPNIEVILGSTVEQLSGDFTHAKNTRVLHVPIIVDGFERCLQLQIADRRSIAKADMVELRPLQAVEMKANERKTLAIWLAARYLRMTFPEALVERMRPVEKIFKKVGEKSPQAILGIYLDFLPKDELLDEHEPYEIDVVVVYDSSLEGAAAAAREAASKINAAFEKTFKIFDTRAGLQWHLIDLRFCDVASDIEFTLQDLRSYSLYRLEHVSLKRDLTAGIAPTS